MEEVRKTEQLKVDYKKLKIKIILASLNVYLFENYYCMKTSLFLVNWCEKDKSAPRQMRGLADIFVFWSTVKRERKAAGNWRIVARTLGDIILLQSNCAVLQMKGVGVGECLRLRARLSPRCSLTGDKTNFTRNIRVPLILRGKINVLCSPTPFFMASKNVSNKVSLNVFKISQCEPFS
jgi:hypothetical protein